MTVDGDASESRAPERPVERTAKVISVRIRLDVLVIRPPWESPQPWRPASRREYPTLLLPRRGEVGAAPSVRSAASASSTSREGSDGSEESGSARSGATRIAGGIRRRSGG